ncbi:MAG: hypothetical protein JNL77_02685 [Nitrosomonas sp.]|nr:hypothetical protein [Nitrosomonas sp.]
MDSEILNRLMVQVIYEIQDFLPANLFHPIGHTVKINNRTLSEEQARGVIASGQAEKLFYVPPKSQFMSLRQRDACELLMHMGHLISLDSTGPEQTRVSDDFYASLKKYFVHLSEQEAKPFISLLKNIPQKQSPEQDGDKKPWLKHDSRDPKPEQSWYTPARYFARQLVKEDSTLLTKKLLLAQKVVKLLSNVGIYKRGGKKSFDPGTIKKAFSNVSLG